MTMNSFVTQTVDDIAARYFTIRETRSLDSTINDAVVEFSKIKAVHDDSVALGIQARLTRNSTFPHEMMASLPEQRAKSIPRKQRVFSLEEVSLHADQSSCWVVIKDRVYDLTDFVAEHPGGSEIMLEHAGWDATTVFEDIGHSADAIKILAKYYIGELREKDRIYNTKPRL